MEESKSKTIWVPRVIGELQGKVYLMSATHRGDMYHIRGALAFEKHPVVLYDCSANTQGLEEYLEVNRFDPKVQVFRTPWTREELSNQQKPKALPPTTKLNGALWVDVGNLMKAEVGIITEGDATEIIVKNLRTPQDLATLRNQMVLQVPGSDKERENLRKNLSDLLRKIFPEKNSKTVVVMHRDSGAQPSGAYPELDSGKGLGSALDTIANRVGGFPPESGAEFDPIYCGDVASTEKVISIGKYWEQLKPYRLQGMSARDLEAFFWQVALEKGYICAAVGFRSGALDLFTFMGIPTVSISLRNMVGESRHAKLAIEQLKRVNVNYEQPRHDTTAWFQDRNKRDGNLLGSPYWVYNEMNGPPAGFKGRVTPNADEQRVLRSKPPGNFANFDTQIVRTGIWVGLSRYVVADSTKPPVLFLDPAYKNTNIVTSTTETFAYNAGWKKKNYASILKYVENQQSLSDTDIKDRGTKLALLQEPEKEFKDSADKQATDFGKALNLAKRLG